jgi:hypothetical protein
MHLVCSLFWTNHSRLFDEQAAAIRFKGGRGYSPTHPAIASEHAATTN